MNRLVILDRDGVINHDSEHFIKSPAEWQPLPGSLEAIAALCQSGFKVAVATNQSGLGRGLFSAETLTAIHEKMLRLIAASGGRLETIQHCPHAPDDGCSCRKPRPGLLEKIAHELDAPLAGAISIGDSKRDLVAARAKNCEPFLVETGKGAQTKRQLGGDPEWSKLKVFADLAHAAEHLIARRKTDDQKSS